MIGKEDWYLTQQNIIGSENELLSVRNLSDPNY